MKFNHTSPVQRVRYNPTMMLLASCADVSNNKYIYYEYTTDIDIRMILDIGLLNKNKFKKTKLVLKRYQHVGIQMVPC